jgi:gag-polyprotein putative aspartyl protease
MAIENKKEYWEDIIRKNPSAYEGKFIIHNDTEIFFVHENMLEAEMFLKKNNADYLKGLGVFLVPHHFGMIRLRLLKIRSLMTGEWTPIHLVNFILDDGTESPVEMIVDSGADITYLPKKVGSRLGLVRSPHDLVFEARSVGSTISYVYRQMSVNINGITLTIKIIWGQDDQGEDEALLGRLDVFDRFDVLFSQKKRKVIFLPNDDGDIIDL